MIKLKGKMRGKRYSLLAQWYYELIKIFGVLILMIFFEEREVIIKGEITIIRYYSCPNEESGLNFNSYMII